jgi:uncharacterized protein (DUF779 family)
MCSQHSEPPQHPGEADRVPHVGVAAVLESPFGYWKHTHLTVDVVPGRGSGFSVESPEGVRFLIRSQLFTDDEWAALNAS